MRNGEKQDENSVTHPLVNKINQIKEKKLEILGETFFFCLFLQTFSCEISGQRHILIFLTFSLFLYRKQNCRRGFKSLLMRCF